VEAASIAAALAAIINLRISDILLLERRRKRVAAAVTLSRAKNRSAKAWFQEKQRSRNDL
jgi:hypothetical protein